MDPLDPVTKILDPPGLTAMLLALSWLAEGPANGLDPEGGRWLRELVRGLAEEGRTVLVSSHILAEVAQTVDTVVIIDRGRLVTQSSLDEFTAGSGRVIRVRTPRAQDLADALDHDGVQVDRVGTDRLEISGSTPEHSGRRSGRGSLQAPGPAVAKRPAVRTEPTTA